MFEIISHGGGAYISQILNGVAMFFGANDYVHALRTCAIMASVGILIGCAFSGRIPEVKWILVCIFVYVFLFTPKVNVTVTDTVERTSGFPTVRVVGNVPIGLAFVATFTSQFSDYLTRGFETVFSLPSDVNYRGGGLLFAEAITERAMKARARDPNINISLNNFWRDCVFYDIGLGFYSMSDLSAADNIQQFLSSNTAVGRAFEFVHSNGTKSFQMCRASISSGGLLYTSLESEIEKLSKSIAVQGDASGTSNMNQLISNNATAMPVAFAYLTKMAKTQTEILSQSILANSFGDGLIGFANQADASSVVNGYVAAKAEAERNTTFSVLGKLSARMLPMLKNIFEGIIYALAPVVGMMMMFPGAHRVALTYGTTLIWISLWAPLFAVLHFSSTFFTSLAVEKANKLCGGVCPGGSYSMYTMGSMVDVLTSHAAIAGYIGVSIPMIAYMLVSRSGAMMASLAGRTMDGYQAPVSKAATEATSGNVSMGNMSYENVSAFQSVTAPSNTAGFSRMDNGRSVSMDTSSGSISQVKVDSGPASMNAQSSIQSAITQQQTDAVRAKESTGAALVQAHANQYNAQVSAESAVSHGASAGRGGGVDSKSSESYTYGNIRAAGHKFAESKGVNVGSFDAAMAELGVGLKVPGGRGVAGGGDVKQQARNSTDYTNAQQAANEFMRSEDFRHALNQSKDAYLRQTGGNTDEASVSGRTSIANADSRTTTAQQNYSAAVEREAAIAQVAQDTRTNGAAVGADLSGYVRQRVEEGGGSWEAFNVSVNRGDPAALNKLQSYQNDYAQEYVSKAVTKSAADIEASGVAAASNVSNQAEGAVIKAGNNGAARVENKRDATNTQDSDAAGVRASAGAVQASAQLLRDNQASAAMAEGQGVAGKVSETDGRANEVESQVGARQDKAVVRAVAENTVEDGIQVAKDAATTVVKTVEAGGLMVEKGAAKLGIDLRKVDEFLGFGPAKDSDKK